jgi:alkenylglycerophosphocholine/alkenylglycerophosphoethanolamine hydrolase
MSTFWLLIALTLVVAVADWWAVATDRRSVEYVLKPLTMVVLIAAALVLPDPVTDAARQFMVAGLVLSLVGDVFLMLDEKLFIGGLVSFLMGHVMYVIGLVQFDDVTPPLLVVGIVVVFVAAALIGSKVVRGAGQTDARLAGPVSIYIGVISLMVVMAFGTAVPVAIVGAVLFYASDGVLGWNKFVEPVPHGRLAVMTTYHLGQIGLVLALAS